VFRDAQVIRNSIDVRFRKAAGMPMLVKLDVSANPVDVRFFRPSAVVTHAQRSNHLIVKGGRWLVGKQTRGERRW
jgi:hypothetical protein